MLAYADDVDIIGRTEADIKKTFIALNEAAVKMGLQVNEEKTKYMICNENKKKIQGRTDQQLKIGENRFEKVQSFVYLGSQMNVANSEKQEINIRIRNANKCYFGLIRYFRSKLLTYSTKVRLYKTLIKPVLMYGSETWVLNENDQKNLVYLNERYLERYMGQ